jgi:hypothetical protein
MEAAVLISIIIINRDRSCVFILTNYQHNIYVTFKSYSNWSAIIQHLTVVCINNIFYTTSAPTDSRREMLASNIARAVPCELVENSTKTRMWRFVLLGYFWNSTTETMSLDWDWE